MRNVLALLLALAAVGIAAGCPAEPARGSRPATPGSAATPNPTSLPGGGGGGGGGGGSTSGDVTTFGGKPPVQAPAHDFKAPVAMTLDASGTIYLADTGCHCIWKVGDATAAIKIGGGTQPGVASSGLADGSPSAALFKSPVGLAVDASHNVYVADRDNSRIRKIAPNGTVSTLAAATVIASPRTVASDGSGKLYAIDAAGDIKTLLNGGVDNLAWTTSAPKAPGDKLLADANGTLYTATASTFARRAPDATVAVVTMIGASLDSNSDFLRDPFGNYYFGKLGEALVRRVDPSGTVATLAGGTRGYFDGPKEVARISFLVPVLAIDRDNAIYFLDRTSPTADHYHLRRLATDGTVATVREGSPGYADGKPTDARFSAPYDLVFDKTGALLVTDKNNHRIRKLPKNGAFSTLVNFTDLDGLSPATTDGATGTARLTFPGPLAVDDDGNAYVADSTSVIRKISPSGTMAAFAGGGSKAIPGKAAEIKFESVQGLAVDANGFVYAVESGQNARLLKISKTGDVSVLAGAAKGFADGTDGRFEEPRGIAVDAAGNVYVADSGNHRIRKITSTGQVTTLAGGQTTSEGPRGFVDGRGTAARFDTPTDVAVDAGGNVYVADSGNHRVRKIAPDGTVTTLAGKEQGFADGSVAASRLNTPVGVAVGPDGNVYVTESGNHIIRVIKQ